MSIGFVRKSSTPASAAARAVWPDGPASRQEDEIDVVLARLGPQRLQSLRPSSFGICQSLTTTRGFSLSQASQASSPSCASTTSWPSRSSERRRMVAADFVVFYGEDFHG